MALIDFVPTLLSAKRLELESHANSRRFLRCGVLLSSMAVAGWAGGDEAHARGRAARNPPPQAEDSNGNPEFYEVFGKRYKVRESSNGYRGRGIASWYGRPFHGRPTSSGEKYDMEEMTAAHTSLPLPTWVEVTNLTNGKTVVVKVNDRGPFVADRLIDLSYAAAKALDIVRTGTARVEVRALDARPPEWTARAPDTAPRRSTAQAGASTTQPRITTPLPAAAPAVAATPAPAKPPLDLVAAATPQPAPLGQDERLFAQAGKFKQRSDAVELVAELKSQGLVNAFIVTEDGRRNSVHRVRIGPLPDSSAVKRMNDQLRDLGAKRSRSVVMN